MYEGIKKVLPRPIRQATGKMFRAVELVVSKGERLIKIEGVTARFKIVNRNDLSRIRSDFEGQYAVEIIKSFQELKGKGKIVNVGAAQGFYVVFGALTGNNVIAIEPDLETFNALNENINLNKVGNKVTCINCALGNKSGKETLFTSGVDGPAPSFSHHKDFKQSIEVPVSRMDDVVTDNPDVVIIDVEGYEEKVLEGMGNLRPGSIFIEIHPILLNKLGTSEATVMKTITDLGYKLKNQYKRGGELHCHFSLIN